MFYRIAGKLPKSWGAGMTLPDLGAIIARLPVAGILAFSLCSTWSVYNLLYDHAAHKTWLYWLPAVLVEIVAAWTVAQVVEQVRELTRSKLSKQDRRFYGIITGAFVLVAAPLVSLSVWANTVEFGNVFLGVIFPVSCIGCAIGAALPQVTATRQKQKESERVQAAEERAERKAAREAEQEAQRVEREAKEVAREAERIEAATQAQRWEGLGREMVTARYFESNPTATQATAAGALGISRRTVGNHLAALETAGLIRRNGQGVEIIQEVTK